MHPDIFRNRIVEPNVVDRPVEIFEYVRAKASSGRQYNQILRSRVWRRHFLQRSELFSAWSHRCRPRKMPPSIERAQRSTSRLDRRVANASLSYQTLSFPKEFYIVGSVSDAVAASAWAAASLARPDNISEYSLKSSGKSVGPARRTSTRRYR